jgi:hypothetical protein
MGKCGAILFHIAVAGAAVLVLQASLASASEVDASTENVALGETDRSPRRRLEPRDPRLAGELRWRAWLSRELRRSYQRGVPGTAQFAKRRPYWRGYAWSYPSGRDTWRARSAFDAWRTQPPHGQWRHGRYAGGSWRDEDDARPVAGPRR